jgi:hypothetical protein
VHDVRNRIRLQPDDVVGHAWIRLELIGFSPQRRHLQTLCLRQDLIDPVGSLAMEEHPGVAFDQQGTELQLVLFVLLNRDDQQGDPLHPVS